VLVWLEKNVQACLDRVDAKDSIVRDYEEKRKRRYMATIPRNIIRHILLTDNKDLTVNLPPVQSIFSYCLILSSKCSVHAVQHSTSFSIIFLSGTKQGAHLKL